VASAQSQLVVLSSTDCLAICMKHRLIRDVTVFYATQFQRCVISAVPPLPFPTDLVVPDAEFGDMVFAMPEKVRKLIGREAAANLSPPSIATKLQKEVLDDKCALVVNASGKVERIENAAAVRIHNSDGRILAQLGETDGLRLRGRCKLPGKKYDFTVTAAEALHDVLAGLFLEDSLVDLAEEVEKADEEEYPWNQVKARNIKTIFSATLDADGLNIGAPVFENSSIFSRISSLRSSPPLPRRLSAQDIFAVTRGGDIRFFAWLTMGEFEVLSEPQYHHYVHWLVSSLSIFRGSTISSTSNQNLRLDDPLHGVKCPPRWSRKSSLASSGSSKSEGERELRPSELPHRA